MAVVYIPGAKNFVFLDKISNKVVLTDDFMLYYADRNRFEPLGSLDFDLDGQPYNKRRGHENKERRVNPGFALPRKEFR